MLIKNYFLGQSYLKFNTKDILYNINLYIYKDRYIYILCTKKLKIHAFLYAFKV